MAKKVISPVHPPSLFASRYMTLSEPVVDRTAFSDDIYNAVIKEVASPVAGVGTVSRRTLRSVIYRALKAVDTVTQSFFDIIVQSFHTMAPDNLIASGTSINFNKSSSVSEALSKGAMMDAFKAAVDKAFPDE